MAWLDPTLWLLAVYLTAFIMLCFRHSQFNWLWGSVILWLGLGVVSGQILPGILGITHLANVYPVYGYIALGSLFLLVGGWQTDAEGGRRLEGAGVYLSLLAVVGLAQHLAFLLMLLMLYWLQLALLWDAVLFYLLYPLYWIGGQAVLMLLMWQHRRIDRQPANRFSLAQVQGIFLISLLMHAVFFIDRQVLWSLLMWLINR